MSSSETLELNPLDASGEVFFTFIFISGFLATGLFLWGLFKKKRKLAGKLVFAETAFLFVVMITMASLSALVDFRFSEKHEYGGKTIGIVREMIPFFSRCFLVGVVSIYKLVLSFFLSGTTSRTQSNGSAIP